MQTLSNSWFLLIDIKMNQSISQALNSKTKENLFIKLFQQKIMERSNLNYEEERKIEIETTNASEKC